MIDVTEELIDHIANLARLELSPEEKASYLTEFPKVLNLVAQLENLDTSDLPDLAVNWVSGLPEGSASPTREDALQPCDNLPAAMANAPQLEDGMFAVPKILED